MNIICAMTTKRVIGSKGLLPWHVPDELQLFKKLTKGNVIIMGRTTYKSIGKVLPDRINIVISRTIQPENEIIIHQTFSDAVNEAKKYNKEIFIAGGATIYEQALKTADKMYLSILKKGYAGDTYFPEFNTEDWILEKEKDYTEFTFRLFHRRSPGN